MSRITMNGNEATLAVALEVARDKFLENAAYLKTLIDHPATDMVGRPEGLVRLKAQFETQAEECQALREQLEC